MIQTFKYFGLLFKNAVDRGVLLVLMMLLAIVLSNSSYKDAYRAVIGFSNSYFNLPLLVNDFLMSIFFLLVGMEIKREWYDGLLSSWDQRFLPLLCACAGVCVPACIFVYLNYYDAMSLRGWAIPTATDIAFTLAVFSIVGKGLPPALRVFLITLAVIDDLIAIIIIALFYSHDLTWVYLFYGAFLVIALLGIKHLDSQSTIFPYFVLFITLWVTIFQSGVHPTISGVLMGFVIPIHTLHGNDRKNKDSLSISQRIEVLIAPLVSYIILPLFAFLNSGVDFSIGVSILNSVTIGVILGLVVGKQLGIFSTIYLLTKMKVIKMPHLCSYWQFYGVSILCGVGFTMSIFVSILAYPNDISLISAAQFGIIIGSSVSAILGGIVLIAYKLKNGIKNSN